MVTLKIVNVSLSPFVLSGKGYDAVVKERSTPDSPSIVIVPDKQVGRFKENLKRRYPHAYVLDDSEVEPEITQAVSDDAPTPPDRNEFCAACEAEKTGDTTYTVTTPDGEKVKVEATHHTTAKRQVYEQLYGTE